MNLFLAAVRVAGAIQVLDIPANLALRRRIRWPENLVRLTPLVRQIFRVHWFYILLVLGIFGVACLGLAPELAGGKGLGCFLSGALAISGFCARAPSCFTSTPISVSRIGWAISLSPSRRSIWEWCSPSLR